MSDKHVGGGGQSEKSDPLSEPMKDFDGVERVVLDIDWPIREDDDES